MKPNSMALAMRDPALAAALGVAIGASASADFGYDALNPGSLYDGDTDDMGYQFGYQFGDDATAVAGLPMLTAQQAIAVAPPHAVLASQWAQQKAATANRERLINPNKGSSVNIERYEFAVNQTITLGTPATFIQSNSPDVNIRPERLTANAPSVGFVSFDDIKVANVSVVVGGTIDAFNFSALAVDSKMDLPTLSPANKAKMSGSYSGISIAGLTTFPFSLAFKGPATVMA